MTELSSMDELWAASAEVSGVEILTPAAQAVVNAVDHYETNHWLTPREVAAAALRAAADQVVPEQAEPVGDSHDEARHDQWMRIRYRFLAIANELEAHG